MRLLLFLVLGVLSLSLPAQRGTVRVLDHKTEQPLPYVNLSFESLASGGKRYTVTNTYGLAGNLCPDSCRVTISYVGFKTAVDTVVAGEDVVCRLLPDLFRLDQVVVTATRTPKALKDAPVITQVITAGDIAGRGLTNMQDVLEQDIPGVEFGRGGFGADIRMQGLEAKNILILVDGERLAGETGYNVDYSRLNTADIDHIEIVKGASSALYGSQAMGGVINIITKKSVKKWELNVGGKWDQRNESNYPGTDPGDDLYSFKKNLDRPNLNFHAAAGFSRKHVNGRTLFVAKSFDAYKLYDRKPVVKDFINLDTVVTDYLNPFPTGINGYRDYQIVQKLDFPLNDRLDLSVKGSWYNHDEYDFVPDKVHQKYLDYTAGGKINWQMSRKVRAVASFHYDQYRKYDYYDRLSDKAMNYRNVFVDPRLTVYGQAGKRQEITGGMEYFSERLFSDKLFHDTAAEKSNATTTLFAQDDITLGKRLNLVAGGRFDYHSVYGAHFSPKVSLMYKMAPLTFRLNYAKGFRSPALKELYIDWPVAWFTIRGDVHLQPETNDYVSASVELLRSFLDLSVTGYYNKLRNKIDGVWQEAQTVYQYVNVSRAELSGVEVLARIRAGRHFLLNGAYSYLHDKRPAEEMISSASPHTGNVRVNYHLRKKKYRLEAILSARITGAKHYVMSEYITYRGDYVEGYYPVHFDPYAIWRFTVSQHFGNGINLTAGVNNLFDHTADVVSFSTSASPGRRFFIALDLSIEQLTSKNTFKNTKK